MTSDQPESEPGHATGPRTRTHIRSRRRRGATKKGAPLAHLRRRCTGGAFTGGGAYLAVIVTTATRPSVLTLSQVMGLEFGLFGLTLLCALVAIAAWTLTENTAFALSVFRAASVSAAANAALEAELSGAPDTNAPPIPIQRGQEIRRHRGDQRAV